MERVEDIVNEVIRKRIDVILEEMTPERAYEEGAGNGNSLYDRCHGH